MFMGKVWMNGCEYYAFSVTGPADGIARIELFDGIGLLNGEMVGVKVLGEWEEQTAVDESSIVKADDVGHGDSPNWKALIRGYQQVRNKSSLQWILRKSRANNMRYGEFIKELDKQMKKRPLTAVKDGSGG